MLHEHLLPAMSPEFYKLLLGVDLQQLLSNHQLVVHRELLKACFHHSTTLFGLAAGLKVCHHHPADVVLNS